MNQKVIIKRECDETMARKKKMLRGCSKECRSYICCIEVDQDGQREHVSIGRSGITFRNGRIAIIDFQEVSNGKN